MITLYEWIIELTLTMKIILFSNILTLLVSLPYLKEIKKIFLIIISREEFKIHDFQLKLLYDYELGETYENQPIFKNSTQPSYTISGSHIILSWNVSGFIYAKSSIFVV